MKYETKRVKREHLKNFYEKLSLLKLQCPLHIQEKLEDLLVYYDEHILQSQQETMNEIKRSVYLLSQKAEKKDKDGWIKYYKEIDEIGKNNK